MWGTKERGKGVSEESSRTDGKLCLRKNSQDWPRERASP